MATDHIGECLGAHVPSIEGCTADSAMRLLAYGCDDLVIETDAAKADGLCDWFQWTGLCANEELGTTEGCPSEVESVMIWGEFVHEIVPMIYHSRCVLRVGGEDLLAVERDLRDSGFEWVEDVVFDSVRSDSTSFDYTLTITYGPEASDGCASAIVVGNTDGLRASIDGVTSERGVECPAAPAL